MDIGVEQVNEPLTAEELIVLVDIMHLVLEEKIRRLEDYIEYRERRHTFDREDIDKLKTYLAECKKKCTIDRINVFGNYEPSNCRWADAKTQNRNKRKNSMEVKDV